MAAWRRFDDDDSLVIENFDWADPDFIPSDAFRMRGDRLKQLQVLANLCQRCGQLWLYPDTGDPAIIVDSLIDLKRVVGVYAEAAAMPDSWEYFYESMYGASPPSTR